MVYGMKYKIRYIHQVISSFLLLLYLILSSSFFFFSSSLFWFNLCTSFFLSYLFLDFTDIIECSA
jgi:hypothetical protein